MPHTSHKNKSTGKKRQEIQGEDGWTHITSNKSAPSNFKYSDSHTLKYIDRARVTHPSPRPAPADLKTADLVKRYEGFARKLKDSSSWKVMEEVLSTRILESGLQIDNCVLFGSGTFSGISQGWDRSHVALIQLAIFKSITDMIAHQTNHQPIAFAQEPVYNDMDETLLQALNIRKLDDPAAFHLLTKQSFAFCPGAEQRVALRSMSYDPAIWLGATLESHVGNDGFMRSRMISRVFDFEQMLNPKALDQRGPVKSDSLLTADEVALKLKGNDHDQILNADKRQQQLPDWVDAEWVQTNLEEEHTDAMVIHRFLDGRLAAPIPNLDEADFPLHNSSFHWRSALSPSPSSSPSPPSLNEQNDEDSADGVGEQGKE